MESKLTYLTKENFWNNLHAKYPEQMKRFCDWIDAYKKRVHWMALFYKDVKYHDLPFAMQLGIFLQYLSENDDHMSIDRVDFDLIPSRCMEPYFKASAQWNTLVEEEDENEQMTFI